jgi:flagellar biosynthesis GTPase FlhF
VEASQGPSKERPRADTNDHQSNYPLENWLQGESWPKEYFESNHQTWDDIKADTVRKSGANEMNLLLARKKSAASLASLRRQVLEANTITPTETIEDKSLPYRSQGYERELEIRGGSYLVESSVGITDDSKLDCQNLLTTVQAVPQDTLFRDDLFEETCNKLRNRNEARVVEDISSLIVPSAETITTYGATELKNLIFNVNERWGESIPITDTRPQPDRCVGFSNSAFTWPQLQKLKPFIGSLVPVNYCSYLLATWRMLFPFLTCEAKCGIGDIDVADKQNAHSMTMAVRGIFQLFKFVDREEELHRKILAFSISHDASIVRIYGHYALIKEHVATFYRHPIREFSFTSQNGRDKWTAYQFTKNVYFEFMPKLHKLICSAIDQISLDAAPQRSNPPSQIPVGDSSGTDPESDQPDSQEMATSAPASQDSGGFKKPRLSANAMLKQQVEELKRQLSERDGNTSEVLRMLQEELERQRQDNERLRQSANSGNDSEVVTILRQELERQRQESKEQLEQQRQESKEQLEQQRQESEQQRQESEQQRQESERQRQEMREQMEQQSKLMETLTQSLPAPPKRRAKK